MEDGKLSLVMMGVLGIVSERGPVGFKGAETVKYSRSPFENKVKRPCKHVVIQAVYMSCVPMETGAS